MIFPSDSVIELRRRLEDRVAEGELSEADAYREALAADPNDPRALRLLALLAEDEGDFAAAQDLAWQWLRADPLSHEAFRLIGRLLGREPGQAARAAAYLSLGREKLHFDPEADAEDDWENDDGKDGAVPSADEPAEVTHEMEPHRLLHAMWVASTGEIEREVVDRTLARGADIAPLLLGVLNLYGEDLLEDVDDALVVRALLLLGEIGDPAVVPALAQFLPLEDEMLSQTASRAFQRLSFRKPAEVLAHLTQLTPTAEPFDLAAQAQQICMMPETPGRVDALLAIERRLPDFEGDDIAVVATALITALYVMDGADSPLAARLLDACVKRMSAGDKREFDQIRSELRKHGPYVAEEDEATIYDLVCGGFEAVEEDEEDVPFVRSEPKLGRNDPCWCGSGKKYKKCHLAADENR
jgi:hypothetical protein